MKPIATITLTLLAGPDGRISRRADTTGCTIDPMIMAGALHELADDLAAVAVRHAAESSGLVVPLGPVAQA